jgi:hypothetical protein
MIRISSMPAYNVMGLKSGAYINKELSYAYCYVSVESICMMFETQKTVLQDSIHLSSITRHIAYLFGVVSIVTHDSKTGYCGFALT